VCENDGEKAAIKKAMQDIRDLIENNKKREKDAATRMFKFPENRPEEKKEGEC
jgi:hypothetical protein